ncbi:sodium- and chloride-dependent GABA transporter ine-like [Penaeus monodon]|uniref:sodium- and chloride-dependent GABA transporter ine-like n=1 Tax=Penaeus monodon TaxID=6687 RepID=UPI0018A77A62|nr:sodium- and chloride-dependent GABA transporter ine-like [Penaeus monodon]
MYVAFFEIIAVVWIYGAGRLAENLKEMTGKLPSFYFRCCWYFAAPVLIFAIWIFSLVDYKNPTYDKGKYKYPDWAIGTGWIIASLSILPTPILAVVEITRAKGSTLWEKIRSATQPKIEQCSCCARTHSCLNEDYFLKEEVREQMKLVAV